MSLWCSYTRSIETHESYPLIDRDGVWLNGAEFVWNGVSANTDLTLSGKNHNDIVETWTSTKNGYERSILENKPLSTPPVEEHKKETKVLSGRFCLFGSWWPGHYGHTMHDSLPIYEKLKQSLPNNIKFLIPSFGSTSELLKLLDRSWEERIVEFEIGQPVKVNGDVYFYNLDNIGSYWHGIQHHREPIMKTLRKQEENIETENIVFCPREGDNRNGRGNSKNDQEVIIETITKIAKTKGANFKVFRYKEHPTPGLQKEFFKDATVIFGVHGTALTNMLWSSRICSHTQKPLQVIECVGLTDAYIEMDGFQSGNDIGYYSQFNNGMNVKWTHLFYHPICGKFDNVRVNITQIKTTIEKALS